MKNYKIVLADGTEFSNLRLNGNNFISDSPVHAAAFEGNCSPVVISDGESAHVHDDIELVQVTRSGEEYWFVLRDISKEELRQMQLRADVDFIMVMEDLV